MDVWFINQAGVGVVATLRLKGGLRVLGDDVVISDRTSREVLAAGNKNPDMIAIVIPTNSDEALAAVASVGKFAHCPVLCLHDGCVKRLGQVLRTVHESSVPLINVSQSEAVWSREVAAILAPANT